MPRTNSPIDNASLSSHDETPEDIDSSMQDQHSFKSQFQLSTYLEEKLMNHPVILKYNSLENEMRRIFENQQEGNEAGEGIQNIEGSNIAQKKNLVKMMKPIVEEYKHLVHNAISKIKGTEFDCDIEQVIHQSTMNPKQSSHQKQSPQRGVGSGSQDVTSLSSLNIQNSNVNIVQYSFFQYVNDHLITHMQSKLMSTSIMKIQKRKLASIGKSQRSISQFGVIPSIKKLGSEKLDMEIASTLNEVMQPSSKSLSKIFLSNISNMIKDPGVEETIVELAPWSLMKRSIRMQTVPTAQLWIDELKARKTRIKDNSVTIQDKLLPNQQKSSNDDFYIVHSLMD